MKSCGLYQPSRGEVFKAISVMQPWASMIVLGMKNVEMRSVNYHHRGTILIHSSLTFSAKGELSGLLSRLDMTEENYKALPRGCYLGIATLTDVQIQYRHKDGSITYGLHLSSPRMFENPMPGPGALGLFQPNAAYWGKIRRQIMTMEA
ncbi:MAG: ASCH domain-containing protein [Ignavibacteria bacterium]|nr:ASCH domain-containing protein [Ignavibacteria bacterium]